MNTTTDPRKDTTRDQIIMMMPPPCCSSKTASITTNSRSSYLSPNSEVQQLKSPAEDIRRKKQSIQTSKYKKFELRTARNNILIRGKNELQQQQKRRRRRRILLKTGEEQISGNASSYHCYQYSYKSEHLHCWILVLCRIIQVLIYYLCNLLAYYFINHNIVYVIVL